MPGGELKEYIEKNHDANLLGLVRVPPVMSHRTLTPRQMSDVAEVLHFLHSRDIVHGSLMGVRRFPKSCCTTGLTPEQLNILVDDAGRARITDFSLATVGKNSDSMPIVLDDQSHTARWTAPEILTEQGAYSKESDVFSFAMVMIEVRHRQLAAR